MRKNWLSFFPSTINCNIKYTLTRFKLFGYSDIGHQVCWWQAWGVGDKSRRQYQEPSTNITFWHIMILATGWNVTYMLRNINHIRSATKLCIKHHCHHYSSDSDLLNCTLRRSIIEPGQNADHEFSHRWIVIEFITIIFWPLHGAGINQ